MALLMLDSFVLTDKSPDEYATASDLIEITTCVILLSYLQDKKKSLRRGDLGAYLAGPISE